MKTKLLLLAFFIGFTSFSQNLEVKDVQKSMSKGSQPGYEIFIPNVDAKTVQNIFKKETKKYKGKEEKVKKSKEIMLNDALVKDLSENTIDFHSLYQEESDGTRYTLFLNLGGIFADKEQSTEAQFARDLVKRIGVEAAKKHMDDVIKDEEKALKKLEKGLEKLYSDKESYEKAIEKAKQEIKDNEANIEQNAKDQITQKEDIEKQKAKVKELEVEKSKIK